MEDRKYFPILSQYYRYKNVIIENIKEHEVTLPSMTRLKTWGCAHYISFLHLLLCRKFTWSGPHILHPVLSQGYRVRDVQSRGGGVVQAVKNFAPCMILVFSEKSEISYQEPCKNDHYYHSRIILPILTLL